MGNEIEGLVISAPFFMPSIHEPQNMSDPPLLLNSSDLQVDKEILVQRRGAFRQRIIACSIYFRVLETRGYGDGLQSNKTSMRYD